MKASFKWLKEFVNFSLTSKELANMLTMAGLEVESIVPNSQDEDDSILEIDVTPNRPDCLSIIGIAREISAFQGLPLNQHPISVQKEEGKVPSIEIKDTNLCHRYSSRIIYGVEVKPPEASGWISKRIESHGIRSTNNIVDITNYVLLEMGHPLHAFDLDKLSGNRIVVRVAGSPGKLLTLDNENRAYGKDTLLICDAEKPVALAGIMGGLNSEVTLSTVNIVLESAYFDPSSIRKPSKYLNLTTEASYRFERGADINNIIPALNRTTQLIVEIAGGNATKITDIYPVHLNTQPILVKYKKITDILGVEIEPSRIEKMLNSLGFENKTGEGGVTVIPPSFRQDIQRDVDIIEEIARLYGYNRIPSSLPQIEMQFVKENTDWNYIKKVRELMKNSGYSEVINYSFLNPSDLDRLKLSLGDRRRNLIKIRNPLKKEEEGLRTTLIPALLNNVRLNINRGESDLRFFEISSVFLHSGKDLPEEDMKMAAVYLKDKKTSLWDNIHDGFYDVKGMLENFLLELGIRNYSFIQDSLNEQYLHPGKSCIIKINDQIIGSMGTLHPEVAKSFEVAPETIIFELDINKTFFLISSEDKYNPLPKYPYIERDIAIIVSKDITAAKAEKTILDVNSEIIKSVKVFDIYEGEAIPEGKKSLAFSIRYRSEDRTLTDTEVNLVHSKIRKSLENTLKAKLRS